MQCIIHALKTGPDIESGTMDTYHPQQTANISMDWLPKVLPAMAAHF